jgi:sigma-B regulation protein RsbU (phosphoserine phosphatase)
VQAYRRVTALLDQRFDDEGQTTRELSSLVSLRTLVKSLRHAGSFHDLIDLFLLTILGEFPCKGLGLYLREDSDWRLIQKKGRMREEFNPADLPKLVEGWSDGVLVPFNHDSYPEIAHLLPLSGEGKQVGVLAFGPSRIAWSVEEKSVWLSDVSALLGLFLSEYTTNLALTEANLNLNKRVFQLETVGEATAAFMRFVEEEPIVRTLLQMMMGQFFISRSAVFRQDGAQWAFVACLGCPQKEIAPLEQPTEHSSPSKDPAFVLHRFDRLPSAWQKSLGAHFVQYFTIRSEVSGSYLICLGPRRTKKAYDHADATLLFSLAQQASAALDNVKLHRERLEKERMVQELQLAKDIQMRLLPKQCPQIPRYAVAAELQSFKMVGGDFFDWFQLPCGRWCFCLADVSGKSLPASLIMSTAQAGLRGLGQAGGQTLSEMIGKLNRLLCNALPANRFVTMFIATLDESRNELTYVNAGHNRPILCHAQETMELGVGGMVLGMFAQAPYQMETVSLLPGHELFIFTDGLSELMDEAGEEFGEKHLVEWIKSHQSLKDIEEKKKRLWEDALNYASHRTMDDMTLLLLRRES